MTKGMNMTSSQPDPRSAIPDVIVRFLDAVAALDADQLADCFHEAGEYFVNFPQPAIVGRENIRAYFADLFSRCTRARWDLSSLGFNGSTVYTERVDRFWFSGQEVFMECVGVFEIEGGRIAVTRDYGDAETFTRRLDRALRR